VITGHESCRLEEHDDVQGMQALEQFDCRLAGAVRKLQELGKWETVVARGGSSPHGLDLASSKFDAEVGTFDLMHLCCMFSSAPAQATALDGMIEASIIFSSYLATMAHSRCASCSSS